MTGERVTWRAYGRTVALTGPAGELAEAARRLPPTYRSADPTATADVEFTAEPGQVGQVLSDLELWVAEHARRFVFVHAGCVVVGDGAIVIPGRTLAGKSSLTAALLRAGASYWSDEYAVLDPHGQVRPYARPLGIRPYDGGPPLRLDPRELGAPVGRGPVRVRCVADIRYEPNLGWGISDLSRGKAVLRLLDNTVPARSRPRAVLAALTAATAGAVLISGLRGDADEAAAAILALLAERAH